MQYSADHFPINCALKLFLNKWHCLKKIHKLKTKIINKVLSHLFSISCKCVLKTSSIQIWWNVSVETALFNI